MNIDKITIANFKNFGDETSFNLNSHLTTIIGINGKGKSSLLAAIKIAAGSYFLGIPDAYSRGIKESEIRVVDHKSHLIKKTPVYILATGKIDGKELKAPWGRRIPLGRFKTTANKEDIGEISSIASKKYKSYQDGESFEDNPIIAFFGTNRLAGGSKGKDNPFIGRELFKLGYATWTNLQDSNFGYKKWLTAHRFMVLSGVESSDLYHAFMDTLRISNPYIVNVGFDGVELRLAVNLDNEKNSNTYLPLSLQSDGMKAFTGMVAELAYRCIVLNGHHGAESVKKSRGIVMIDEVDLHIHPIWQRHILRDLKAAFPLIQFVVTTHSAFIVQSLESNELINLDAWGDVIPQELTIDEVSTHVMQVDSEFSEVNQTKFTQAKNILTTVDNNQNDNIADVSDPVIRAVLELKRLANKK